MDCNQAISLLDTGCSAGEYPSVLRQQLQRCVSLKDCASILYGSNSNVVNSLKNSRKHLIECEQYVKVLRNNLGLHKELLSRYESLVKDVKVTCSQVSEMEEALAENKLKFNNYVEPKDLCLSVKKFESKSNANILKENRSNIQPTVKFVRHLTTQEFENAPGYMKGRLKYEDIVNSVEAFNKTLKSKYELLSQPRSKLTKSLPLYNALKKQECQATKGVTFCTDKDLKEFGDFNTGLPTSRRILQMLRHTQHIYEIRDNGLLRYAVLN